MGLSFWQVGLVVLLLVLLFGRGKIPALMSDVATGIKNFRSGMRDGDESGDEPERRIADARTENRASETARDRSRA